MELIGITRTVKDVDKSSRFYTEVLGFQPDARWGGWQSFHCQPGVFYAVGEETSRSTYEVAFGQK